MLYIWYISTTYCVLYSHATLGLCIVNVALYSLSTFSPFVPDGNKLQQSPKWTDVSATRFEIQKFKHVRPFQQNLLKSEIKKQYKILTLLGCSDGRCLKKTTCDCKFWNWNFTDLHGSTPNTQIRLEKKNQPDATEWFIALIIRSKCFGHLYAHHQELETICVLLPPMVCNALVAGGRGSGAGQQAMRPGWGMLLDVSQATSLIPDA